MQVRKKVDEVLANVLELESTLRSAIVSCAEVAARCARIASTVCRSSTVLAHRATAASGDGSLIEPPTMSAVLEFAVKEHEKQLAGAQDEMGDEDGGGAADQLAVQLRKDVIALRTAGDPLSVIHELCTRLDAELRAAAFSNSLRATRSSQVRCRPFARRVRLKRNSRRAPPGDSRH